MRQFSKFLSPADRCHRGRRGVAMLLVIISLMTATIVTVSYLSSRDNSAVIGQNVVDASAARWCAMSGLEIALAMLQTEADWRTNHADGVVVRDLPVGDGRVTIHVWDIETDSPPTAASSHVNVTVRASVGGIEQQASALALVATSVTGADDGGSDGEGGGTVQLDLAEFAIFAEDRIYLGGRSLLTRWEKAPLADLKRPVYLGVRSIESNSLDVRTNATPIDAVLVCHEDAPDSVVNTSAVKTLPIKDFVPYPAPPALAMELDDDPQNETINFSDVIDKNRQWNELKVNRSGTIVVFRGDLDIAIHDLELRSGTGIRIDGNVRLLVERDFTMEGGSFIEILDGASLTMSVRRNLNLEDAYIGDDRKGGTVRDNLGTSPWFDTRRIYLFGHGGNKWDLSKNSVIKGNLYAPGASISIQDQSAVYGRIAGDRVELRNSAALYYDTSLNRRCGFVVPMDPREPRSPAYDADDRIREKIASTTLDIDDLRALSSDLGIRILALNYEPIGQHVRVLRGDVVAAGDSTPRPIPVEFSVRDYATDWTTWEHARR